jgi:hypothetical protein
VLTKEDVARRRLANQALIKPRTTDPVDVVRTQGAVQAQDYPGAKWAIGMRTRGATDADVELAMTDGRILRTHVLRPTWHFVAPEDIRWMLTLTAPFVKARMRTYDRTMGLTEEVFAKTSKLLVRALRDGAHLMRSELSTMLVRGGVAIPTPQHTAHILMRAELDALIVSGARKGNQFTYALLDERAPSAKELSHDESLVELARRYFATRSPATAQDFAWWSGLNVPDAKRGIEMAELKKDTLDGKSYWYSDSAKRAKPAAALLAHLLPNYDELFIGFRNRSSFNARSKGAKIDTDTPFSHVVELDGQNVGFWKRTVVKGVMVVQAKIVVRLSAAERAAVQRAAERYAEFLDMPVRLEL